jgi:hypothetical protein
VALDLLDLIQLHIVLARVAMYTNAVLQILGLNVEMCLELLMDDVSSGLVHLVIRMMTVDVELETRGLLRKYYHVKQPRLKQLQPEILAINLTR